MKNMRKVMEIKREINYWFKIKPEEIEMILKNSGE
jgi:hypothetical protein